jgi:hypothetical protein
MYVHNSFFSLKLSVEPIDLLEDEPDKDLYPDLLLRMNFKSALILFFYTSK